MSVFTAVIVQDSAGGYVGHVPGWPGAHSQGETLDELRANLGEVIALLLESGASAQEARFVGTLFVTGVAYRVPTDVAGRARRKLDMLHRARSLRDLRLPTSNRLHALSRNRKGQFAIAVNDQWRICFRFVDGDAFDVEFCDYH